MTGTPRPPDPAEGEGADLGASDYLAEAIRRALATDCRVHEQGLEVTVSGQTVVLRGTVPTTALRDAAGEVARELAPDAAILNHVEVPPNAEPDGAEEIE